MSSFRFAVLGDTHYCTFRGRPPLCRADRKHLPDYFRYVPMAETLRTFADRIREARADLLFSTGDLIEGGADDRTDEQEARAILNPCTPAFFLAPGTHDAPRSGPAWRRIDHKNSVFLILDYTDWKMEQKTWLIRELEQTEKAEHRFVFAHPPLHLFGRHFFYNPDFCRDVEAILKRFPVDVYFCGHTHNQTVSFHSGMLQITSSSIGYPAMKTIALEELHAVEDDPENRYFWGIAEDSTPAYWTVDVESRSLTLRWHSLNAEAEVRIPERRSAPEIRSLPPFVRECVPLTEADRCQIRCGWVNFFTANRGAEGFHLQLNGIPIGRMPESRCYAARRFLMLPQEVLRSIGENNTLEVEFPQSEIFAAGSLSLELLLLDGRTIRSRVAPELFVCGSFPDFEYAASRAERVQGGGRKLLHVDFLSPGV